MLRDNISLNTVANSLAINKANGTCVEILNTYIFDKVKYVNFIKPGTTEVSKLTMKEFHHLYYYINSDFLKKVVIPSYNIAVQKGLVSVNANLEQPSFEVNHNACK